jgi:REP element-mobilizing transposase RayT
VERSLVSYNGGVPPTAPRLGTIMLEPLYTSANCRVAYQLHWSLALFATQAIPHPNDWLDPLQQAMEPDGVRILESSCEAELGQFFLSTRPEVSPVETVRVLKGRLQYQCRATIPKLWRRHYCISSVGDASSAALQGYVGRQVEHHPMADSRMSARLSEYQFHDPHVDLDSLRTSNHGKYACNVHVVLENAEHLSDVRREWLATTRDTVVSACRKKQGHLSRLSLVSNHMHLLLGCAMDEAPQSIALSLMNNIAYAHGMKPVLEHSFYVGTFGAYDHDAIRLNLADVARSAG